MLDAPAATVGQALYLGACHLTAFNASMREGMLITTYG